MFVFSGVLCLAVAVPTVRAAITWEGNVEPSDPTNWDHFVDSYVGYTLNGSLTVNSGSQLRSRTGYIGYNNDVTGVVTVDGNDSTWSTFSNLAVGFYGIGTMNISGQGYVDTNHAGYIGWLAGSTGSVTVSGTGSTWKNRGLYVGNSGSGLLNISSGGTVTNDRHTYVAFNSGSSGIINFGTGGGTLTTRSLFASPTQLTGTGTINTRGLVSDVNLVFDSTHGLSQTLTGFGNITVNLDMSNPITTGVLGAGYKGNGSVLIRDGMTVGSTWGTIGHSSGATGSVTVNGIGSTWNNQGYLSVGRSGSGTLNIIGGGSVHNISSCNIAMRSGSTGVVTVDGSSMTCENGGLIVGYFGNGTLNIANGGVVTVPEETFVAPAPGSMGTINFHTGGGTLTTAALCASPTQLAGTGTINTHGLVSDIDLVFDTTHGLSRTFTLNSQPNQNITVNLDMSGPITSKNKLGAGYLGTGSLAIRDGIEVDSGEGFIGYLSTSTGTATVSGAGSTWNLFSTLTVGKSGSGMLRITGGGTINSQERCCLAESSGSTGMVTVDGSGSTWTNIKHLSIGNLGNGMLNIINGGAVSNADSYIGDKSGSMGTVMVDGSGSMWINNGGLYVGNFGSGTLNISNGGVVTTHDVSINSQSLLAINVNNNSSLNVGGDISNNGTVRVIAGPIPAAGAILQPISTDTWSGSGTYQALGGTWDADYHEFTVSEVLDEVISGQEVQMNLGEIQRVLVGLPSSTWSVGASFLAKTGAPPAPLLDFTATAMVGEPRAALQLLAGDDQSILGAWQFSAEGGYSSGEPAYLSCLLPTNYNRDALCVWHYEGDDWAKYAAYDLTCNGTYGEGFYASFTVTSFSGYAVTLVPEPGALTLLMTGLLGALAYAWRKRWQ
jgi:T5SS/PEP-CTERM-associated repeat protein